MIAKYLSSTIRLCFLMYVFAHILILNAYSDEVTHSKVFLSKPETKRLVYFIGHKDEPNSALITQVCKDFETFSALLHGECATRTLSNLYNLHALRGVINSDGSLCFKTSMSGPHHYFGWLDPRKQYTIEFEDGLPIFKTDHLSRATSSQETQKQETQKIVPDSSIVKIIDYNWMTGSSINQKTRELYAPNHDSATSLIDTDTGKLDSLFDAPGILALGADELTFNVIQDAHLYDLSPYCAQMVPNNIPFAFNQELVAQYKHAQHKLRVVTYNYGDRYLHDYIMRGSGIFVERHEFVQSITPMNKQCGGFVLLGREVVIHGQKTLELIAVTVPFGYTLLVDVGSIHGDSTLTGLYMMAMTGNHNAMKTADTVFMKNYSTYNNVSVKTIPPLEPVTGLPGADFFLTSDEKPLKNLIADDKKLKSKIMDSLNPITALWWHPVITTGTASIGWSKTLGTSLPKV